MNRKEIVSAACLTAATVVFMGIVHIKAPAARYVNKNVISGKEEALEIGGAEGIKEAVKVWNKDGSEAGYIVTAEEDGFGGKIVMEISIDAAKTRVLGVNVTSQSETPELGGRILEEAFQEQFKDAELPVYLPGMWEADAEETKVPAETLELTDGSYAKEAVDGDYTNVVYMTVENGCITEISMDAVDADGNGKCMLSEQGMYQMTEDGLTWKEQAEALAAAIIDHQSTGFLNIDAQGKTDAVSGVSISISNFVHMLEDLMETAAGIENESSGAESLPEQGTVVDAVSGATISSTAVVNGVNHAFEFLNQL